MKKLLEAGQLGRLLSRRTYRGKMAIFDFLKKIQFLFGKINFYMQKSMF